MSDFQHRHYAHVAALLAKFGKDCELTDVGDAMIALRESFAEMFARDNYRFDERRFYDACVGLGRNKDVQTARRRMGFAA